MSTTEQANQFLRERYIGEFNRLFARPAGEKGTAFRKCSRNDLDMVFSIQTERMVDNDNTVTVRDRHWQLERTPFRRSLAGCRVTICEHLDGMSAVRWGPHLVGRFDREGRPVERQARQHRSGSKAKGATPSRRAA